MKTALESSLGRLRQHADRGFFIVSAFRGEYDLAENLRRHKSLQADVRSLGLGFIELNGMWVEAKGTPDEQLHEEVSLFVPWDGVLSGEEFFAAAVELMEDYSQDAVVYREPGEGQSIEVLDNNQNTYFEVGSFQPDKIAEIYSSLRYGSHASRTFVFESVTRPDNYVHAMLLHKQGHLI